MEAGEKDEEAERRDDRLDSRLRLIGREGRVLLDLTLPALNGGQASPSSDGDMLVGEAAVDSRYDAPGEPGVGASSCGGDKVEFDVSDTN